MSDDFMSQRKNWNSILKKNQELKNDQQINNVLKVFKDISQYFSNNKISFFTSTKLLEVSKQLRSTLELNKEFEGHYNLIIVDRCWKAVTRWGNRAGTTFKNVELKIDQSKLAKMYVELRSKSIKSINSSNAESPGFQIDSQTGFSYTSGPGKFKNDKLKIQNDNGFGITSNKKSSMYQTSNAYGFQIDSANKNINDFTMTGNNLNITSNQKNPTYQTSKNIEDNFELLVKICDLKINKSIEGEFPGLEGILNKLRTYWGTNVVENLKNRTQKLNQLLIKLGDSKNLQYALELPLAFTDTSSPSYTELGAELAKKLRTICVPTGRNAHSAGTNPRDNTVGTSLIYQCLLIMKKSNKN